MTFFPFIVVVFNKTAKLTTPTLQLSLLSQNILKIDFLLCLWVHLQITSINYAQKILSRPGWLRLWE